MAYNIKIKPDVTLYIQFDVVKKIHTNYTMYIDTEEWASDSRNYKKGSAKYITNINYNTTNVTELYKYGCKPFESGSKVIDNFLNENGWTWSSYTITTGSFTENEYWAETGNNSLPTMSVSPYTGQAAVSFQTKYFPEVEVK